MIKSHCQENKEAWTYMQFTNFMYVVFLGPGIDNHDGPNSEPMNKELNKITGLINVSRLDIL